MAIQKMQEEVNYLGSYYAIFQHFLSTIVLWDYHPSMHVENDP